MAQIVFVVWRETVEALLVVGVLNAWLSRNASSNAGIGRVALWTGISLGIVLAVGLAALLLYFTELLGEDGEDYLQCAMAFAASALIVQMVSWTHRATAPQKQLLGRIELVSRRSDWLGIFILSALAVAREGSETVVFLYGSFVNSSGDQLLFAISSAAIGFLAAVMTYALLQMGGAILSWRWFFKITEIMLLMLAAALVMTGIDRLSGLGLVPYPGSALWDTSAVLDDNSPIGNLISSLTGYRARPDAIQVGTFVIFWLGVILMTGYGRSPVKQPT